MTDPKSYWVGFNMVKGIGSVRFSALLDHFERMELAWSASRSDLLSAGLSERIVDGIIKFRGEADLDRIWKNITERGIQVLTWNDEDYPKHLKQIDQPPPVIYTRGRIDFEDDSAIAIVGTRRASAYGRQIANDLAGFLARNGITVVSGLARGIDGIAHESAIKNGGRTLAVLGSGVDVVYPPEHRLLSEKIIEQGALVSDYPPGTPPDSTNFPPRNRIISGLSMATVVIEAGETSGALITASFAANQGRDVFAVPGNINAPQSCGTNRLIENGARPLLKFEDLMDALSLERINEKRAVKKMIPADPIEQKLTTVLSYQATHIDEIVSLSSLPIEKVSATLAMMELKGMVHHVGSMSYVLAKESQSDYWTGG
ncbi:MAG: DNA-protecting protein DprA [Anaerolineaceae bacterium]|nr:DNA-protecting protein DprA [Anaerolineaceae bacterium]